MKNGQRTTTQPAALPQLLISVVIPLVILTRFSAQSQLGPTKSLVLALAFPVAFELYSVRKTKRLSAVSALAIVGILITGAISLLGLSENWLAVRRSVPYLAAGLAVMISIRIKRPLLKAVLPRIMGMEKITGVASKKHALPQLERLITRAGYMASGVLFFIAFSSYVLTRIVIVSPTGTTGFNQEYAKLRILSLPFVTLPLLIGTVALLYYLMRHIEKLTGLDADQLLNTPKSKKTNS